MANVTEILNIAALRTTTGTANQTVEVLGYYAKNDGGGGQFCWNTVTTAPSDDNGGTIIVRTGVTTGRWERVVNTGLINVRWFGAIVSMASGLSDVTTQVHAARDVARDGTVFFPKGTYPGAFQFFRSHGEINLLGEGTGSILTSNGTTTGSPAFSPNPVLRLGWGRYGLFNASVSNLYIDGRFNGSAFSDGVIFDDSSDPQNAGKWIFEKVIITNCLKGISKPKGNYGNTFSNCVITSNEFGYYANGSLSPQMHAGADRILGGLFTGNSKAAIYVGQIDNEGYGQLIVDGPIIEQNPGFGILMKFSTAVNRMPVEGIELRNIWMEANATVNGITIDGTLYPTSYDYYFEQVRGVMITGAFLRKLSAKASSIMLINCRGDLSQVDIDSQSAVVADGLRYCHSSISQSVFVNSICYDGTVDIGNHSNMQTSVWGPLRSITQTANNNILLSQRYNAASAYTFRKLPSGTGFSTTQAVGGVLRDRCAKLTFSNSGLPIEIADTTIFFDLNDPNPKYYVWSIHAYFCQPAQQGQSIYGYIGTEPAAATQVQLGEVILKHNTWACSYGVKRLTGNASTPPRIYLNFGTNATGGTVLIADYQVLKFDNFADATSFLNSRSFGEGNSVCPA